MALCQAEAVRKRMHLKKVWPIMLALSLSACQGSAPASNDTGVAEKLVAAVNEKLSPPGFHDQFITLPSGHKAYCNRQGYREVERVFMGLGSRTELVTTPDGNFVECDAKVGPPGDDLRTDSEGTLLTPDQIAEELDKRYDLEQARIREEMAKKDAVQHAENERMRMEGEAQMQADQEQRDRQQALQAAEDRRISEEEARCRQPYDTAQSRYMNSLTQETGRAVSEASTRMNECLRQVRRP